MKHEIVFLGKTKDSYIQQGIDEYVSRLRHYTDCQLSILKDKSKGKTAGQVIKNQGEQLLSAVAKGAYVIGLDSRGRQFSSEDFSRTIVDLENSGVRNVCYLIGGPDGISQEVLEKSKLVLSFSKMTFTHDMIRMLLVEQIYRAYTIKNGEKYHK